jgi:hypothetical protein
MSIAKALSDSGCRGVSSKNKVKNNGLFKALADCKRTEAGRPDKVLRLLDENTKYVTQLDKAKEVAAWPTISKYIADMTDAAQTTDTLHRTGSTPGSSHSSSADERIRAALINKS